VIVNFADRGTEDIFNGINSAKARRKCPSTIWSVAQRKLDLLDAAAELNDLASPPGNMLEPLDRNRKGQHGIRINDQYRICFAWISVGPKDVEITDYH
jgi:proteic killer suppression protein